MRAAFYLGLSASICVCVGLSIAAHAASMEADEPASLTKYDGVYSVEITTQDGPCDNVYRGSVTIENGRITGTSDPEATASGLVEDTGTVSLTFRRNDEIAHVGGQISGRLGGGPWSSPTSECGGRWRAERQG